MYPLKRRRRGAFALSAAIGLVGTMAGAALTLSGPASAQGSTWPGRYGVPQSRPTETPIIAVVGLRSQRIIVYSARGKMLEAPVSTGKPGNETPAGIFSILQKRRYHYSNLYNDASMPFMQRITWSGIALHAGDLPGYPASHGCIRLPYAFAGQLFELTKRGMRVVVARDDVSPIEFAHPALFRPAPLEMPAGETPAATAAASLHLSSTQGGGQLEPAALAPTMTRRALVALKTAAAEAAAKTATELRRAASRVERDAATFEDAMWEAERAKKAALARIEEADILLSGSSDFADELKTIKAKAQQRLAAAQAEIDAIYAKGKDKIDAARAAREEAKAAEAARATAQNEAALAAGRPVSVFVSRKTQRLYVRRAFQPLFESPVTIRNPKAPIGTTIFTAVDWANDDDALTWTALSMYHHQGHAQARRHGEPAKTSADAARAALERLSIPQDAIDRISQLITPGSALIISDEALSRETGEATDFIVVMSGEPQGGIATRRPTPYLARMGPSATSGSYNFFRWW